MLQQIRRQAVQLDTKREVTKGEPTLTHLQNKWDEDEVNNNRETMGEDDDICVRKSNRKIKWSWRSGCPPNFWTQTIRVIQLEGHIFQLSSPAYKARWNSVYHAFIPSLFQKFGIFPEKLYSLYHLKKFQLKILSPFLF